MKTIVEIDDDGSFEKKYYARLHNSKAKKLDFTLTRLELARLLRKAGIKASDWGIRGGYDLARYGDKGGYTPGNCRFITHAENVAEMRISERGLEAIRQNSARNGTNSIAKRKADDPIKFRKCQQKAGKLGAKRLHEIVLVQIRLEDILRKKLSLDLDWLNYPQFGWKSRLAHQIGDTKRSVDRFLKRNPDFIQRLEQ